jgi:hypothetical protein
MSYHIPCCRPLRPPQTHTSDFCEKLGSSWKMDREKGDSDGRGEGPGTAFAGGWNGTGVVVVTFSSRFPACSACVKIVAADVG